jgi:IS4 transposase
MRSLFRRLNIRGIDVDISTFSKASKTRNPMLFYNLFIEVRGQLRKTQKIGSKNLALFPVGSTIVTLTSKLLWSQGYHQVKLLSGLNLLTAEPGGIFIHFGQGHDSKYGNPTIDATPENGVSIMDRGFSTPRLRSVLKLSEVEASSLARIKALLQENNRYFILRIKNNIKLEMLEDGQFLIGTGEEQVKGRVVNFCDLESRSEFRFVTNLPEAGESGISNEEIGEFYRLRWQIELFWKFLKMHLKLDRLITKNINGIQIQIYTCLIADVLLQLVNIPKEFGDKLLDKLRYLQAFMCENISYVHWLQKLVFC